jgi:Co/Zn/Cd efflux system component
MYNMTAHALTDDLRVSQTHDILERLSRLVQERFNICHANIQFECRAEGQTRRQGDRRKE